MVASKSVETGKEIELKLELDPTDAFQVKSDPLLASKTLGAPVEQRLVSTYFDTPNHALAKAGVFLRVRESEGRYVQTVKSMASKADLIERSEWEQEIADSSPDLDVADGSPLRSVLTGGRRSSLRPIFVMNMQRTLRRVIHGGSTIEVALDEGEILAGARTAPISEVELELKEGDAAQLFSLARALCETVPLRLAVKTKAERGFELLSQEDFTVEKAGDVDIKPVMTAAQAFRAIARNCLRQIIVNERAVFAGRAEALHQMRVGLRRLRAAISIFSDALADGSDEPIKDDLKWITQELGPARDLDVFAADVLKPLQKARPKDPGVKAALRDFEERRKAAYARAIDSLRSERHRKALLSLAEWIEVGGWASSQAAQGPIVERASAELARLRKGIRKRGKDLRQLSAAERHKLRIRAKRLRYATEFFASTFPGERNIKRRDELLSALKDLQDALGGLNDLETRHGLMGRAEGDGVAPEMQAAIPDPAREEASRARFLADAERAFARFADAKAFWDE
ncbi:CHAD domain-containing protein [Methyloceanibacter sp.]|uniref:CYTH and CHAD domain-containing protein n=1 Tax=Methyloceanibacter sp. TaxID=1965321 RepID=UPI002D2B8BE5|nr:CHAD domain-containing protein [Methyloceanibacter sp.]HZP09612.1 CHAD domain-containing protein [Methyloceanibacter sp.]